MHPHKPTSLIPPHEAGLPCLGVFVNTPIEECERRDPKCHYGVARAGELSGFNGFDAPYETPGTPDLELRHGRWSTAVFAARVLRSLDAAFEEYEERLDQP